jgi:hypothetical protein
MTDKLLDFVGKRQETIEKKRRSFERVMFQNFLGAYSVLDDAGSVYPVELVDISREGCLFQIPWNGKGDVPYANGQELNMRLYFTKGSYVPVVLKVKRTQEVVEQDGNTYLQYGAEFDKSMPSFKAVESFIEFVYRFAEHSRIDRDETRVFFL